MPQAAKKDASFERNFQMLEQLSRELQENRVSIDELVPRIKDALGAIKACKDVLKQTKSQLAEIGKEFEEIEADFESETEHEEEE